MKQLFLLLALAVTAFGQNSVNNPTNVPASANGLSSNASSLLVASTAHNTSVPLQCSAASASGTAYTCATVPTFTPADGDTILFEADVANTGAATINVNASAAAPIKKQGGGTALVANDLLAGQDVLLIFDGVNWQMQGQIGNVSGITNGAGNNVYPLSNGTNLITSPLSHSGTTTTLTDTELDVGLNGTASGILGLKGSTSGTATFTAPAVAGTTQNAFVSSNAFSVPLDTIRSLILGTGTNMGFSIFTTSGQNLAVFQTQDGGQAANVQMGSLRDSGNLSQLFTAAGIFAKMGSLQVIQWGATNAFNATADLGLSRDAAGVLACGNGTQDDVSCTIKVANYKLSGTIQNNAATATMGLTLKKGTGAGNYTSASTTYVVVDSTNLCLTITIPTGWKLGINAGGALGTATGAVVASMALTDNASCATANAGILVETTETTTAASTLQSISLPPWVITGDGASHNIALQFKTSNAGDSATILNSSATSLPTMVFTLMPSN